MKKRATCPKIVRQWGNGTCHVDKPRYSAIGWKNQIYRRVSKLVIIYWVYENLKRTWGNSIVKWENNTNFVHSHSSRAVGTLFGCSFHRRKYGIASIIIQGIHRPKYTTSCSKKDNNPVAMAGSSNRRYHCAHLSSIQDSVVKSTFS